MLVDYSRSYTRCGQLWYYTLQHVTTRYNTLQHVKKIQLRTVRGHRRQGLSSATVDTTRPGTGTGGGVHFDVCVAVQTGPRKRVGHGIANH